MLSEVTGDDSAQDYISPKFCEKLFSSLAEFKKPHAFQGSAKQSVALHDFTDLKEGSLSDKRLRRNVLIILFVEKLRRIPCTIQ